MLLIGYNNTATQSVPALGLIDFGSPYREYSKTGCCGTTTFAGTGVAPRLNVRGIYHVTAVVTYTAPVAGDVSLQAVVDGDAITGLISTESVETADTEFHTTTLDFYVLVPTAIFNTSKTISIQSSVALTVTNAILNISKEV